MKTQLEKLEKNVQTRLSTTRIVSGTHLEMKCDRCPHKIQSTHMSAYNHMAIQMVYHRNADHPDALEVWPL